MEIMIPATKVLKEKKVSCYTKPKMADQTQKERTKSQKHIEYCFEPENPQLSNRKILVKSKNNPAIAYSYENMNHYNVIQVREKPRDKFLNYEYPKFQKHHEKIDCYLYKKSTRSSLHEIPGPENLEPYRPYYSSNANLIICKGVSQKEKKDVKVHFQLEKDEFNEEPQRTCKICLDEESLTVSHEGRPNPLIRVCKCHDLVHIDCLYEWINHRDLNGRSQVNQCYVCRYLYHFELCTENFLSLEILKKNMSSQPFAVACRFILMLIFFAFSVFCLFLFIELFASESYNGGYIRETINMPYVTCIVIIILILFVAILIFGTLAYTFATNLCLDFKYKIGKSKQQESKYSSRNLKNLITDFT